MKTYIPAPREFPPPIRSRISKEQLEARFAWGVIVVLAFLAVLYLNAHLREVDAGKRQYFKQQAAQARP